MLNKKIFTALIIFLLGFNFLFSRHLQKLSSTEQEVKLDFELENYEINYRGEYSHIEAEELIYGQTSGDAQLPIYTFLVGIPPDGAVSYQIKEKQSQRKSIRYPVSPIPHNYIPKNSETSITAYKIDEDIYYKSLQAPLVEVSKPFFWRDQRVVRFTINPFRVENRTLDVTKSFQLDIKIEGDNLYKNNVTDNNLKSVFRSSIINFEVAKKWQRNRNRTVPDNPFDYGDRWFKIPVVEDGIYKITKSHLQELGIDVDNLDASSIQVYNGGGYSISRDLPAIQPELKQIPVFVKEFGTDDYAVFFYARDTDGFTMNQDYNQYYNPYTGKNYYWLTYNSRKRDNNSQNNIKITGSKSRQTLDYYFYEEHLEEEKLRIQPRNDHYKPYESIEWYWYDFSSGGRFEKTFEIEVSNLDIEREQEILIQLASDNTTGTITVYVNGEYVGSGSTSGYEKFFAGDFFQNGNNTIKLEVDAPTTARLALDYIDVGYYKDLVLESDYVFYTVPDTGKTYDMEIGNVDNQELQVFKITNYFTYEKIEDYEYSNNTLYFSDTPTMMKPDYCVVEEGGYIIPQGITEKFSPTYYYSYINDKSEVVEIETSQYWLRDIDALAGTDLIIVSPEIFYEKSKELAYLHSEVDGMKCAVVKLSDVYDEFSWGLPDVVGIRLFLKYAFEYYGMDSQQKPAYAIFPGDGTNDFREYEKITAGKNKFPPFEENLRCSDSYYVFFEDDIPSMMTGRIPAQTSSEFEIVVNKTIDYVQNPDFGPWRSNVILCPDDFFKKGDFYEYYHTQEMEIYCANKIQDYCQLDKVYAVEYPFDQSMNKPEVTADLIESINEGSSIFFYAGHGGYFVLGDEDYFRATRDISKLTNAGRLNFFIASSCNIGEYDSNVFQSLSEKYINAPDKGGIAAYSATRGTAGHGHCCRIVDSLVINAKNDMRLGEAILLEKGGTIPKSRKVYSLLGDPAIKLAIPPTYSAFSLPQGVDSIKVRQKAKLSGNFDQTPQSYDKLFIKGLDSNYDVEYESTKKEDEKATVVVTNIGKPIFRGTISPQANEFSVEFIVPDDAERGDHASLVAYALAEAQRKDAWLTFESPSNPLDKNYTLNGFLLGENPDEPNIDIWLENKDFTNGSYTSSSPKILAEISDSNGINITNKPGHRILLTLDDEEEYNVTEYFSYNTGSYRAGSFEYQLDNINPGDHTLNLKVFDNYNKSSHKTVDFKVKSEGDISVRNVLNYPNPIHKETYFTFYLDGNANVDIKIYTIAGKLIREINNQPCTIGFNKIKWDGLDADGDRPANGLYFYKIKVNSELDDETYKLFIQH